LKISCVLMVAVIRAGFFSFSEKKIQWIAC
jgi:hypothetical protein